MTLPALVLPFASCHALRRARAASLVAFLASVLWLTACDSSVAATNPYDPATDPSRQAKASLSGRLVLWDQSAERSAVEAEILLAEVGLAGADGEVLRSPDGSLLRASLNVLADGEDESLAENVVAAEFEFVGLEPRSYRLRVDGIGSRYVRPAMPTVDLRPGASSHVGDITFATFSVDGGGPGEISGRVRLEGRAGEARTVELYRMKGAGPELARLSSTSSDGGFSFTDLPVGAYAVRAALEGFYPDQRMDLLVGEAGGAMLTHELVGEEELTLRSVTAALIPSVQQTEGTYYTNADTLPIQVLPFVSQGRPEETLSMRLSADPGFAGESEEEVPYVPHAASTEVMLPDRNGPVEVFAQFKVESAGGFEFISPVVSTMVVRDSIPPRVMEAVVPGARTDDNGRFITSDLTIPLLVEATDDHSAVSGIAYVHSATGEEPGDTSSLDFDSIVSSGGLVRWEQMTTLDDDSGGDVPDGIRTIFVYARDRATNVSDARRLEVMLDRTAPNVSDAKVKIKRQTSGWSCRALTIRVQT